VRKKACWFPLQYNVSVHSAVKEKLFLASCGVIVNPPYSPNLIPGAFEFTTAKTTLKQITFQHVNDINKNVNSLGRV
jgi:hypothetical protein